VTLAAFFAAIADPPIKPAASADAVEVRALRRVKRSRFAFRQISPHHYPRAIYWRDDIKEGENGSKFDCRY